MEQHHDEIFEKSNQIHTYKNISVNIYEKMFEIGSTDITKLLNKGNILRIADCCVDLNKEIHFKKCKKKVWNKGMVDSTGMLAGVFCKGLRKHEKYLVASLWDNDYSHQLYVEKIILINSKFWSQRPSYLNYRKLNRT